jgi:N-methylhydantoinase B/oxoprolinase/acetone carboxylase alpha subunit
VNRRTVSEARKMMMQPDDEATLETPDGGGYAS